MIPYTFPTIAGNYIPYKSPIATPIAEIYTTDTTYTVKHRGIKTTWHAWATYESSPNFSASAVDVLVNPKIKFYSGSEWPIAVSSYSRSKRQFGVHYEGVFIPNSTSATFYLFGSGYGRIKVGSTSCASVQLTVNNDSTATIHVTGLTVGVGVSFDCYYWSFDSNLPKENSFCAVFEDSTLPHKLPVTTGHVQHPLDFSSPLTSHKLPDVGNVALNLARKTTGHLQFSIPINQSTDATGYKYVKNGDYFQSNSDSTKKVKKFRFIELHTGYYIKGSAATITKFTGQIVGWEIKRGGKSGDVAIVDCYDWSSFLSNSFNSGNPDPMDFCVHGYHYLIGDPKNPTHVAGINKPRTYDGWHLYNAIENCLFNADIDPIVYIQKTSKKNVDGNYVNGEYLFKELSLVNPIILDRNFRYGKPLEVALSTADSPYVWQTSIGQTYINTINNMLDNYGIEYKFNNYGYFSTKQYKTPIEFKAPVDFSYSNFATLLNSKLLYAYAIGTQKKNAVATISFTGVHSYLVVAKGLNSGTLSMSVSNPTLGVVYTASINLNNSATLLYGDGPDSATGINPCLVTTGTNLMYGKYTITLTVTSTSKWCYINGLVVNDQDYGIPNDYFYSGDLASEKGVIIGDISLQSNVEYIRNNIVIVGKLTGLRSQGFADDVSGPKVINPQNPIAEHITARAVDLSSLGSLSNQNFVGRELSTIVINQNISSDERAQWLATEMLRRYNQFGKSFEPTFELNWHPLIDIDDYTKAIDIKLGVLGTISNFWVTSIIENYRKDKFTTSLGLNSFKPWDSFFNSPTPSLKLYNGIPITNAYLYDSGIEQTGIIDPTQTGTATVFVNYGEKYISIADRDNRIARLSNVIPRKGYIKVNNEVIKYTQRTVESVVGSGSTGYILVKYGGLTRGMYATTAGSLTPKYGVEGWVSPYAQETMGISPNISFELLAPGEVKVEIWSIDGRVDVLTGTDPTNEETSWDKLPAGTTVRYNWNCLDRFGTHNETNVGQFEYSGSQTYDIAGQGVNNLGEWLREYKLFSGERARPGAGYYVANRARTKYASFQVIVSYRDTTGQYLATQAQRTTVLDDGIYTVIRPTGHRVENETDGIREEFSLVSPTGGSGIRYTDASGNYTVLPTIWTSFGGGSIKTYGIFAHPNIRAYYRDAVPLRIGNATKEDRVIKLGGVVDVHTFQSYEDVTYKVFYPADMPAYGQWIRGQHGSPFPITRHDLPLDNSSPIIAQGTPTLQLTISGPSVSYLTGEMQADLSNRKRNGNSVLVRWAATHLHVFRILITDNSGRKATMYRSIYWVPDSFDTTTTKETDGGNQGTTNYKVSMWNLGSQDFSIPYENDIGIPPGHISRNAEGSYINMNTMYGVLIYTGDDPSDPYIHEPPY